MTSLREFIETASTNIERRFNETGAVHPMFHFIDGEGKDVVMLAPPGGKDTSAEIARVILWKHEATRCVVIDEAWLLDAFSDPNPDAADVNVAAEILKSGGSIRNHPKRIEAVVFLAEDATEGMLAAYREIVRKINSRARLGPLKYMPTGGVGEGRLVGLLPRGKLSS